jgi:hypothetical protein
MENINENKIVVFSQSTAPIISEIIQKYNLKETPDQMKEAGKRGRLFRGGIVLNIVENIVLNKLSKNNLVEILKREMPTSDDIATKMAVDINNKLLSIATIMSEEEFNKAKKNSIGSLVIPEKGNNTTVKPARLINEITPNPPKEIISPKPTPKKEVMKPKKVQEIRPQPKIQETKKSFRKNDTYREPIE